MTKIVAEMEEILAEIVAEEDILTACIGDSFGDRGGRGGCGE